MTLFALLVAAGAVVRGQVTLNFDNLTFVNYDPVPLNHGIGTVKL